MAIIKEGQYTLHKKHTFLEVCKSVGDILLLIGEKDLCVDEVKADVGLMDGYVNDPDGLWSSRSVRIDPAKPIYAIASRLVKDVVLTSDEVSKPDTRLKACTWVVVLEIVGRTTDVYQRLLEFGYSRAAINKWHATLTPEQLTLSAEERVQLIANLALNTL